MATRGGREARLHGQEGVVHEGCEPSVCWYTEPPVDEEGGTPVRSGAPGGLGSQVVQCPSRRLAWHSLTEGIKWQLCRN